MEISKLSIIQLIELAQKPQYENPQLEKEKLIQVDFLYLKSLKNGDSKPIFSHETIISILGKVYFLKENTITQILYGNYQKRRKKGI